MDALLEIGLDVPFPLVEQGAFVVALFEGGYVLLWMLLAIRHHK